MAEKTISLREVRHHVEALDKLVTDSWFDRNGINYADLRKHAYAILDIVGKDDIPHAATATKSPAAAADAKLQDYLSTVLGVAHVKRS